MSALITPVIFLGLDSLVAAFGLAPFVCGRAAQFRLAAWFGLCDMLGSLAGASECVRTALPVLAPHAAELGLIFAAFVIVFHSRLGSRAVTVALPILLSIDNLASPLPLETSWLTGAALAGVSSAVLAFAGMRLGSLTARPAIAALRGTGASTVMHIPVLHPAACPLLALLILVFF
jgi:hypothetical protein